MDNKNFSVIEQNMMFSHHIHVKVQMICIDEDGCRSMDRKLIEIELSC